MHYYIDGYNLLFRVVDAVENLQTEREAVLAELGKRAQAIDLSATIVFDAHHQPGPVSRGHYKNLEIVYTSEKESADEYIHRAVLRIKNARFITVVTSDKKLAWLCRVHGANTQSISAFLKWLNSRYQNELMPRLKKEKPPPKVVKKDLSALPALPPKPGTLSYYEAIFEGEMKEAPVSVVRVPEKVIPQKVKPEPEKPAEDDSDESDFDRWLRTFQRRVNDE